MDVTVSSISVTGIKESDLHLVSRWRREPGINMFIRPGRRTLDEVKRWYRDYFSGETNELYLISYDGDSIGYFTIEGIDHVDRKCEFGIVIGEVDFHNKGIGRSVIKMMLEKAFDEMGMHRILAVISEDNAASIRCFSKAGFTLEGRHREAIITDNEFKDILLFSIVEDEWRSQKHPALK